MSRVLSLRLLGSFEVEAPSGLVFATRKIEALVAFLALPAGVLRQRSELAELLWGSRDEAHGRHSLSQALSALRKSLAHAGVDALIADGDRVGFDPAAVTTDVAKVNAILGDDSPDALSALSELWRGDLLAGLDIREEAFEDWLSRQRIGAREGAQDTAVRSGP